MKFKECFSVSVLAVALALTAACAGAKSPNSIQDVVLPSPSPTPAPAPKEIVAADLKKLRWIEGSWRGTGGGVPTFMNVTGLKMIPRWWSRLWMKR
jgi:hypothetical protein